MRSAEELTLGPIERARLLLIRELVEPRMPFDDETILSMVGIARTVRDSGDRDLALEILWMVAARCWWSSPRDATRKAIVTAADDAGFPDDEPRVLAIRAYAMPIEQAAPSSSSHRGRRPHGWTIQAHRGDSGWPA